LAKEEELAYLLESIRQSMENLIHPLTSMLGMLSEWSGNLPRNCQDLQEIHELQENLDVVLAIVSAIAGKTRGAVQATD
jgi:hypothetical protein